MKPLVFKGVKRTIRAKHLQEVAPGGTLYNLPDLRTKLLEGAWKNSDASLRRQLILQERGGHKVRVGLKVLKDYPVKEGQEGLRAKSVCLVLEVTRSSSQDTAISDWVANLGLEELAAQWVFIPTSPPSAEILNQVAPRLRNSISTTYQYAGESPTSLTSDSETPATERLYYGSGPSTVSTEGGLQQLVRPQEPIENGASSIDSNPAPTSQLQVSGWDLVRSRWR